MSKFPGFHMVMTQRLYDAVSSIATGVEENKVLETVEASRTTAVKGVQCYVASAHAVAIVQLRHSFHRVATEGWEDLRYEARAYRDGMAEMLKEHGIVRLEEAS